MEEGSRTVFKEAQPTPAHPWGRFLENPEALFGEEVDSARLREHWRLERTEGCPPLVQLAVNEVLSLVG